MEHLLIGGSSQRGFARESLGDPPTFKLWQLGHNRCLPIISPIGFTDHQIYLLGINIKVLLASGQIVTKNSFES